MKTPLLLKTLNHTVCPSAVMTGRETVPDLRNDNVSLLTTTVNFEQGVFRLQGDWHFMMSCNKHAEAGWFNYPRQQVTIEASLCPACTIDLQDDNNDGAVFIIEGNISGNDIATACSGLLVLDKTARHYDGSADTWNISFYLYDDGNDDVEIALKIPVLVYQQGTRLN